MSLYALIKGDYRANRNNPKGFILLLLYRVAHAHLTAPVFLRPLTWLYLIIYKFLTELVIGTEIHWRCEIGPNARIYHGYGLVIHSDVKIGSDVVLRHGTTIGMNSTDGPPQTPVIGNFVDIGASAILLGAVKIGDHARIGAGSVVVRDVPDRAVVVGNPARVVRIAG